MTPQEFRDALEELGINQAKCSKYFEVNPRTVSRWINYDSAVPKSVEICISMWLKMKQQGIDWIPDSHKIVNCPTCGHKAFKKDIK